MKIVSILVFLGAMVGSWCLVHSSRPVAESMHVSIQGDLKNIITDFVQKQLPNSQNLRFEKFWTETVKKDRVKASFVYSFDDSGEESGPVTTEIRGFAILNKVDESLENVTWSLDELNIQDSAVNFQDPVRITGSAGELEKEESKPDAH